MVDFYRQVDPIKEQVIPPQDNLELLPLKSQNCKLISSSKIIGSPKIVDGISVRCPKYLLSFSSTTRKNLVTLCDLVDSKLEKINNKYYYYESKITGTLSSLHSDHSELLIPNIFYIGVAAMAGSVLTKRSNILYRVSMPVIFGTAGFYYTLPKTYSNTIDLLHEWEESKLPKFTKFQDATIDNTKWMYGVGVDLTQKVTRSGWKLQNYFKNLLGGE
ncbi:hypothetical protein TBLA_0B07370 [Henningerozyma blattae CBS 6284]|uniref:MICOS complex subunit n=1 Tax=Henningerozyma blattae (strain ATCC 34711 / CBS 6284 / DSM 70876 / NBRC 10599 / NRRL Y-10934 / UCD 77-7) TaxID=1071380 RepID=I2GZK3_HENB6|nr:hypothetical protein TBLA_0B07370 [Tetrapisispora blattae CBS 6284]CCH59555.1 hypothetical protein TBLA_0B07370 [Tetrapisispora blattae CBS 6284]